jgi:hypothetical protein
MIRQGAASASEIDTMLSHAWRFPDQEKAFSGCVYAASRNSVSSVCGPWLGSQGCTVVDLRDGIKVQGSEITALLLNQALDYFQKGLYNFFAQYILAIRGLVSWARVTNYYASFFSIHSLLCLQGRTITRLRLGGGEQRCHVVSLDLTSHEYVFSQRGIKKMKEHHAPWERYYAIYDRYSYPCQQFEVVHKKQYMHDPVDEVNERNEINYVPFRGFAEMINQTEMSEFKSLYVSAISSAAADGGLNEYLSALMALATDPVLQYFARVALRLLFAADIFKRCASSNDGFRTEWSERLPLWRQFARTAFSDPPANLFEALPQKLN